MKVFEFPGVPRLHTTPEQILDFLVVLDVWEVHVVGSLSFRMRKMQGFVEFLALFGILRILTILRHLRHLRKLRHPGTLKRPGTIIICRHLSIPRILRLLRLLRLRLLRSMILGNPSMTRCV